MRHHLALVLACSSCCTHAIRDGAPPELAVDRIPTVCKPVEPDSRNPWRFILEYERAIGLLHDREYTLRPSPDCTGKEQGHVSVIPKVDPMDPLGKSRAIVTVQPVNKHDVLFVCGTDNGTEYCLASIQPPGHRWRPHQLLMALPGLKTNRKLLDLHLGEAHRWIDVLEWTMLVIVLCFLATTCHAGYILAKFVGARAPGDQLAGSLAAGPGGKTEAQKKVSSPVDISDPFSESLDAWVNSLSFAVASVSLLGVLLSVLVNANGHPCLIILTILWPVTCGNMLLYYFWMSTCRLQLYAAALSRGICVRGINPVYPSMILMGGCVGLLLLCAVATGYTLLFGKNMNEGMSRARQISPFVFNPITSLFSVCLYVHFRSLSQHKTQCPMAIDEMVHLMKKPENEEEGHKEPVGPGAFLAKQLVSGTVPIVSEHSFCQLCRMDVDPVAAIASSEPLPRGPSFHFLDLAWQGRVVYELCGHSVAILNMPVVLFFFLVMTASSVSFGILGLTVKPSISTFEMSTTSLGRLHPELSPWQVDYELVLDSSVQSATFLTTLPQEGTSEISMRLPGKQEAINTSNRSVLASVVLVGTEYPSYIDILATGLGRATQYQMSVVKNYELVIGARMVPIKDNGERCEPRFINWGEVAGSTFTLPDNVNTVELTLLHKGYSMGIPINETMAEKDDTIAGDILTVFQPMKYSSAVLCRSRCTNVARCLISMPGRSGCFSIWTPRHIRPEFFDYLPEAVVNRERECGCTLAARICRKREVIFEDDCHDMERKSRNLLNATLHLGVGFLRSGQYVNKRIVRFIEHYGDREVVDSEQPDLTFTRGYVLPAAVLTYTSEVDTYADVSSENGKAKVQVTIQTYNPNSRKSLVLVLALLVPDNSYTLDMEESRPRGDLSNGSNFTGALHFWGQRDCQQSAVAQQYDICQGWRRTLIVSWKLDRWTATGTSRIYLHGSPKVHLMINTVTKDGEEPAQWGIRKDCALDLRLRDPAVVDKIFTQKAYESMIFYCSNVTLQEPRRSRSLTSVEMVHEALVKFGAMESIAGIFSHVERSKAIGNVTEFFNKLSLRVRDGKLPVIDLSSNTELKFPFLLLLNFVKGGERGGLVDFLCRSLSDRMVHHYGHQSLETSVRAKDKALTHVLTDCIKSRVNFLKLEKDHINPVLVAIKLKDAEQFKHVMAVTTCCYHLEDGTLQNTTYLEYSVAFGCTDCINSYLSTKLCGVKEGKPNVPIDFLFFNKVTGPSMWDDLKNVNAAMGAIKSKGGLRRLAFSETRSDLTRILSKLEYMANRSTLREVTHFSLLTFKKRKDDDLGWSGDDSNEDLDWSDDHDWSEDHDSSLLSVKSGQDVDEDIHQMTEKLLPVFCSIVQTMSKLQVLYSGSHLSTPQLQREYLTCLSKLPQLERVDFNVPSLDEMPAMHAELRNLRSLKKIDLFVPGYAPWDDLPPAVENLRGTVLPADAWLEYVNFRDTDTLRERFFERKECFPKDGTTKEYTSVW